jgi:hypothetical protein
MAAHRPRAAWAKPRPVGYARVVPPEPFQRFVEELRPVDPASISAGESCPPAFSDFQAARNAARVLAYQWSAWASVVAAHTARGFLVLTGAHEEFLESELVLVQVGPEGQERYPWATE